MSEETKTVHLRDLCPDRYNFKDKAFEAWVDDFMARYMPGFPIGMLDTSSEQAFERWEIEPEERYKVVELNLAIYTCHDCGEEYPAFWDTKKEPEVCCPLEAIGRQQKGDEPELFELEKRTWLALADLHYGEDTWSETAGDEQIDLPPETGINSFWGWHSDDREGAEQKALEMNYESMRENSYGFPWANGWCYYPDERIRDGELKEAGFTVATYLGGKGDWREDEHFRLCGIDGGGYSFKGAHAAPLAAAVAERWNMKVPTDSGPAYIRTGEE